VLVVLRRLLPVMLLLLLDALLRLFLLQRGRTTTSAPNHLPLVVIASIDGHCWSLRIKSDIVIEVQILSLLKASTIWVFIRLATTTSRLSWMTTRGIAIVHDQPSNISSFLVRGM
jgi:hypothetical protein